MHLIVLYSRRSRIVSFALPWWSACHVASQLSECKYYHSSLNSSSGECLPYVRRTNDRQTDRHTNRSWHHQVWGSLRLAPMTTQDCLCDVISCVSPTNSSHYNNECHVCWGSVAVYHVLHVVNMLWPVDHQVDYSDDVSTNTVIHDLWGKEAELCLIRVVLGSG